MALLVLLLLLPTWLRAEGYVFRYVNAVEGNYDNEGTTWATATNNLQNAIDDVWTLIAGQSDLKGYIFVAGLDPSESGGKDSEGMVYVPTKHYSDDVDASLFTTSFCIYERIYVFGGFKGDEVPAAGQGEETLPDLRIMSNGKTMAEITAEISQDDIENAVRRWNFKYRTVLSGNHSQVATSFTYDKARERYATSFPLSSYHVVWFGTNGTVSDASLPNHFRALRYEACVDGCTITDGYASSTNTSTTAKRDHTGFGGGVYMVKNALLRNCIVERCAATLRGGGVYMDGGGELERCYVHTCQAAGIGVVQGYGGGVCIDYDGAVKRSYIIQSAARIGAGLAICHVPGEYPEASAGVNASAYDPYAVATVVANCTSTAEGGGVYLDEGGTLNHCTVVNNKCTGPDVVYYGRRHGRTGGVYVRSAGTIYNSVAWGNSSPVNNDVQFASFREANATSDEFISIYHSAFSHHDITNWANAQKESVVSLTTGNEPMGTETGNFPFFAKTTAQPGIQYNDDFTVDPTDTLNGSPYQKVYNWRPQAVSALRMKAVQVSDAVQGITEQVRHAHTDIDIVGRKFEAVSSCGALAHSYRKVKHTFVKSQEEGEEGKLWPTIFIDPNRVVRGPNNQDAVTDTENPDNSTPATTGYLDSEPVGDSWDHPGGNLPDAIQHFKQYQDTTDINSEHYGWYLIPTDENPDGEWFQFVQILVKTGQLTVAGTGSYLANSVRTASIRPVSNMRLYGGFAASYTGTNTDGRNQRKSPTRLSADVIGGGYANNSSHVVSLVNCRNVIVDGFRLYYGNANLSEEEMKQTRVISNGAGLLVSNSNALPSKRIDMTGNILRNCVISNCTSAEGSGIFVNGQYPKANGNMTHAELSVVNTIIRNTSTSDDELLEREGIGGVVVANGNAIIHMDHCGLFNNRGYPLETLKLTGTVAPGESACGQIDIHNSVIYANAERRLNDRLDIDNYDDLQGLVFSEAEPGSIKGTYVFTDSIKESYLATHWPSGFDATCQHILTYTVGDKNYPAFRNPSRNVGHNEDSDQPLYGGTVDYEPMNTNPIVNAAGDRATGGLAAMTSPDLDAGSEPRSYGGDPDLGAIENTALPPAGAVLYVTPDGAGRRDGSSWANAIAGNTIYALNGAGAAGTDKLDEANNTTRIINTTNDGSATVGENNGNGVLTTDNRYCGGFATATFTDIKEGGKSRTEYTHTYTTETNDYGGGKTEVVQDNVLTVVSSTPVVVSAPSTPGDFVTGIYADERYPYGEISGQTRTFWRATGNKSPVKEDNTTTYGSGYRNIIIKALADGGLVIGNDRTEHYVSGLQYAVEQAASYNALKKGDTGRIDGVDSVQVWVSNGKYTDYKGFIMRDNTTVLGSFPAVKGGSIATPGLSERQALMSAVINIPKALTAESLAPADYETILQVSDENPKANIRRINPAAVKFWDNDWSVEKYEDTQTHHYISRTIVNHYEWKEEETDVTANYVRYADFTAEDGTNIMTKVATQDFYDSKGRHRTFGTPKDGNDGWHLRYMANTGLVHETNLNNGNNSWNTYTQDGTIIKQADGKNNLASRLGLHLYNGPMTGLEFWQTMKNVPQGQYRLEVDMTGYYDATAKRSNDETGITFLIIDSDGTVLNSTPVTITRDATGAVQASAYTRYPLEFNKTASGDLTIKVEVGEGAYENNQDPPYTNANANSRQFYMDNVKLFLLEGYNLLVDATTDETTVLKADETTTKQNGKYNVTKERKYLRKRVLQMPDVTCPTYGPGLITNLPNGGGTGGDDFCHTERVPNSKRTSKANDAHYYADPDHYKGYTDVVWDGFTIRHGFLYDEYMSHGGGAGVNMYEGSHLRNCVVIDNYSAAKNIKGGGIFCDGSDATIEGCFVLNNTTTGSDSYADTNQEFAGGMFMYEGTCFNSLFANNFSWGVGGGLGFCVGRFFNNTVAYNESRRQENIGNSGNVINGGAISLAISSTPNLFIANTIFYGNNGRAIRERDGDDVKLVSPFIHCYVQSAISIGVKNNAYKPNIENWSEDNTSSYGIGNLFLNGVEPSAENTPFEADLDEDGNYTGGAKLSNDYRLRSSFSGCINMGTEDFKGKLSQALTYKKMVPENQRVYTSVTAAVLPDNDVAYADRIQDCEIDIGAYEYDGAKDIEPDLSQAGKAIFYVSQNGGGGLATASSPKNAACSMKLQKVLDAAGRWKYAAKYLDDAKNITQFTKDLLTNELKEQGVVASDASEGDIAAALDKLQDRTVIVKLAGDYTTTRTGFKYAPTRSTETALNAEENILQYSFIVPRGVQVMGGYDNTFSDDTRDVIGNPTRLGGSVSNAATATSGNVFHVVTFTDNLFGIDEKLYRNTDNNSFQLGQLAEAFPGDEDRAVVDGLFIQDGNANGTDDVNRRGGGAVVPDFAHVRNCIVTDNQALTEGGGLYLQPGALVSGSIIKNNTAYQGGGLYVEAPKAQTSDTTGDSEPVNTGETNAHVYTSTIIFNEATATGGGIFYSSEDPNLVANSSVFWQNKAGDLANVAGDLEGKTVEGSNTEAVYAFNYCGVENRRVPGINNLELPTADDEGVRWNHYARYEDGSLDGTILYAPITQSSIMARSGMTYDSYKALQKRFPTLELEDMARLVRMDHLTGAKDTDGNDVTSDQITMADGQTVTRVRKDNAFIEMGARVLNLSFAVTVDTRHVMTRLFVAKTENLPNPDILERLQQNIYEGTDEDERNLVAMYKQMGSSFANPFHRFGDALDYIKDIRSDETLKEEYRNTRFEIFLSEGEYHPYRDAYGQQGSARMNTFVIPEGVTVIGGVKMDKEAQNHYYCQAGYGEDVSAGGANGKLVIPIMLENRQVEDVELNVATTQQIRSDRLYYDYNGNNVFEPWEMQTRSKLMGDVVDANSEGSTNVYHVITCLADQDQVGALPDIYSDDDLQTKVTDPSGTSQEALLEQIKKESQASRDKRTIILDGLLITGGYANNIEPAHAVVEPEPETGETPDEFLARKGRQNATQLTYFRGGGILAEGNWDKDFLDKGTLPEVLGVAKRDIPLLVANCEFQNNVAGNGGAIYANGTLNVVGCHFTQNLSVGPLTTNDQQFIPWTAGGAIATNYHCNVWNTLFDNNEARRGNYKILSESENPRNTSGITNADERQGSGGVISSSETSVVHMANCDLVMNLAEQFPAIYNFYDNSLRNTNPSRYGEGRHYALNTVFWGNRVNDPDKAMALASTTNSVGQRKRYHVANFGPDLDQEVLYFCAYEDGMGRQASTPELPAQRAVQKETQLTDVDALNVFGTEDFFLNHFKGDDGTTTYNNNQIISDVNHDADGPYFVQPSTQAGIDGYMQNADWLVGRLNELVDNGWSYLEQEVTKPDITSTLLTTKFYKADGTSTFDDGKATNNASDGLSGSGYYNLMSKQLYTRFKPYGFKDLMPIADETYMNYTRDNSSDELNMRRISARPKMGQRKLYVDIGVYEYQYVQLAGQGSEVDVIWVGPQKKGLGDGTTAQNCSDDLQGAIETLLLSRNGHDKMVKLIGGADVEYSPINMTSGGKLAFYVKVPTSDEGITLPANVESDVDLGIKSLTIRGGYGSTTGNDNDGEELRDLELYPVKLVMKQSGYSVDKLDHLFVVENVAQRLTYANYLSDHNSKAENEAVPVILDGLTFENACATQREGEETTGGAALYYLPQSYKATDESEPTTLRPMMAQDGTTPEPKLIVKDCTFQNCGASGQALPAVTIGGGGGQTLVVNSVFHSNQGNPLEAVNTKVVNCTFAMNGGHLVLAPDEPEPYTDDNDQEYPSELHNSVIWQDDQNNSGATQFSVPTTLWTTNDPVNGPTSRMTYNAIMNYGGSVEETPEQQYNMTLSDDNSDVFLGPNFDDPKNADVGRRSFHVNVSNRLIARASKEKYRELVPYYATYPDYARNNRDEWSKESEAGLYSVEREGSNGKKYYFHSVQRGPQTKLTPDQLTQRGSAAQNYTEVERSAKARLLGGGMERGAYESVATMQRVLYVDGSGNNDKNGTDWRNAYPIRELQNAIDLAGIYSLGNGKQAYVFVKNGQQGESADPLVMRDGVSVYGGISSTFRSTAVKDVQVGDVLADYSDPTMADYVAEVKAGREGIAAKGESNSTTVRGLTTSGSADFTLGFVLDGCRVVASGPQSKPVVQLTRSKSALAGCVVTGNTVGDGQPVVQVDKGLLYNSLVYDNTATTHVSVGTEGYVLNSTVVADGSGETPIGGVTTTDHVQNTIGVNESAVAGAMFAPYLRPDGHGGPTAYSLSAATYLTDWKPYWYQLHEQSHEIDGGQDSGTGSDGGNQIAQAFSHCVNFGQDRDVLGNPRRLGLRVDNGAFETWRIGAGSSVLATNVVYDKAVWDEENLVYRYLPDYTVAYGGHQYPHRGSVVYLEEGANLVFAVDYDQTPRFTTAILPGYVLLKKGASVYGQGNPLRFSQVAAERHYDGQYGLTALPFAYDVDNAYVTSYDSGTDALTQQSQQGNFTPRTYDSEARAAWDYHFRQDDSQLWTTMASRQVAANQGWLMDWDGNTPATMRFTGWGQTETEYAYSEDDTNKTVTLTQYNHIGTADATGAHFTKQENMGWNLKGMPWLVSSYPTKEKMDVPHVIYSDLDNTTLANGQFFAAQSWSDDAVLSLGQGFFTQTATLGDTETLAFRLPIYTGSTPTAPARHRIAMTGDDGTADVVEVVPSEDSEDSETRAMGLAYRFGVDGVKWFALDETLPQLYVDADGLPLSLLTHAPVGEEIPLGVTTSREGRYVVSLPEPEAFEGYEAVWLIDHQQNTMVNLLEDDYAVALTAGDHQGRLALQFGGLGIQVPTATEGYDIYTVNGILHIDGLSVGDQITVYTMGGNTLLRDRAIDTHHTYELRNGIYLVRVNNYSKKVSSYRR